jgi:hypothetical protein
MNENQEPVFEFDKFMQDIVKKESNERVDTSREEITPQREYAQKYRELPQNRTRWTR